MSTPYEPRIQANWRWRRATSLRTTDLPYSVATNRNEPSMPPKLRAEQEGFSFKVLRAMMNGEGVAMLDLPRATLIR